MSRPGSGKKPQGRGLKERVRTGKGRTVSQKIWLERQLNDPYVKEARRMGYRSRAAFKTESRRSPSRTLNCTRALCAANASRSASAPANSAPARVMP